MPESGCSRHGTRKRSQARSRLPGRADRWDQLGTSPGIRLPAFRTGRLRPAGAAVCWRPVSSKEDREVQARGGLVGATGWRGARSAMSALARAAPTPRLRSSDWLRVRQLTPALCLGPVPWHCARPNIRSGAEHDEQVPEDLTKAEVADRLEADRSEDEGDTASPVDRWDDEGGTTAPAEPSGPVQSTAPCSAANEALVGGETALRRDRR